MDYAKISPMDVVEKTIKALVKNGIRVMFLDTVKDAKLKVLELIPPGSTVMNVTSATLDVAGLTHEIKEGGKYISVRNKIAKFDPSNEKDAFKIRELWSSAEWVVGSVHAVTQDGQVLIASRTGAQLGVYVYGAAKLIWVVGTQKIVPNLEEGFKRIYKHYLALDTKRPKAENGHESAVNKVLIVNKELEVDRITLIFVNEAVGF